MKCCQFCESARPHNIRLHLFYFTVLALFFSLSFYFTYFIFSSLNLCHLVTFSDFFFTFFSHNFYLSLSLNLSHPFCAVLEEISTTQGLYAILHRKTGLEKLAKIPPSTIRDSTTVFLSSSTVECPPPCDLSDSPHAWN